MYVKTGPMDYDNFDKSFTFEHLLFCTENKLNLVSQRATINLVYFL